MNTVKIAHHRNGISGHPFTVGIIKDTIDGIEREMLIIQFDDDKEATAVFDLDLLKQDEIDFAKNSWRGDHFMDQFASIKQVMLDVSYL